MFAKSTILLAVFAAAVQLVAADTPPACLLAAVSTQTSPGNLKAVCGNATIVENTLSSNCGSNAQAALSAFSSICSSAGITVSTSASSSSATSSAASSSTVSSSASIKATSTMVVTAHYYDTSCSCTKTTAMTTTSLVGANTVATSGSTAKSAATTGSTGSTGTSGTSGTTATGSSSSASASATSSTYKGTAVKADFAAPLAGLFVVAGLALTL